MSPDSVYLLHENLPEYGLAVHLYVEDGSIQKTTFSVLRIVEEKGKMLTVWPVDELLHTLHNAVEASQMRNDIIKEFTNCDR